MPDLKIEAPSCCHMPTQGYYTTHKKIIIKRKKKKTFFLLSKYPYRPRLQFLIRAPVYNFYMMGSRSSSFPGPLSSQYWPGVYGRGEEESHIAVFIWMSSSAGRDYHRTKKCCERHAERETYFTTLTEK